MASPGSLPLNSPRLLRTRRWVARCRIIRRFFCFASYSRTSKVSRPAWASASAGPICLARFSALNSLNICLARLAWGPVRVPSFSAFAIQSNRLILRTLSVDPASAHLEPVRL